MSELEHRLAALRAKFVERLKEDRQSLEPATVDPTSEDFRHIVHRLAGTAGTMGFPQVSAKAATLEQQMLAGAVSVEAELAALRATMDAAIAQ